ncbi:hypothetical protein [Flavobacterium sp. FlaQc-50]|uniref:hypothetical protein n=1 Tax=unclassified Flavobacterium TaxID=196869 RepID=UPI003756A785
MKTYILNSVLLLLFSSAFYAQEKEDSPYFRPYSSSVFNTKEVALSVISSLDKKAQNDLYARIQSGVQIQQIGDYNTVNANLKATEVKVSVNQQGNGNELFLDKNAKTITQNIIQKGNDNAISDFTLHTNYKVNTQMIQNGDNQNIKSIGTNSMSKNMKITQTGNGASLILINK